MNTNKPQTPKKYNREDVGFVYMYRACLVMLLPFTLFIATTQDLMSGYPIGTTLNDWWNP